MESKKRKRVQTPYELVIPKGNSVIRLFRSGNHVWLIEEIENPKPDDHVAVVNSTKLVDEEIKRFGLPLVEVREAIKKQAEKNGKVTEMAWYASDMYGPDDGWFFEPDCLVEVWIVGERTWVDQIYSNAYSEENMSSSIHEMVHASETEVFDLSLSRKRNAKRDNNKYLTVYHFYDGLVNAQRELVISILKLIKPDAIIKPKEKSEEEEEEEKPEINNK